MILWYVTTSQDCEQLMNHRSRMVDYAFFSSVQLYAEEWQWFGRQRSGYDIHIDFDFGVVERLH